MLRAAVVSGLLSCGCEVIDVGSIQGRKFRVAIDLCNGACGEVAARFLGELGCRVFSVNEEPSGEFAHAPAPSPRNMRQLGTILRCFDVDLGAAVNVDGDRIGFVLPSGEPLSEEYTLPLTALSRLARRPGPVVTNYSTSSLIDAVAERYGQPVLRTNVGEGYVIDRGLTEGAVLAGEGSGGVAALPATTMFDSLLTLGLVLEGMARNDTTLPQMVADLPHFEIRKG